MNMRAFLSPSIALAAILASGLALAASVSPVLFVDWQSGDAYFEAAEAGNGTSCGTYAWKVDEKAVNGSYDTSTNQFGNLPVSGGPTITISNNTGEGTFDWEISDGFTVCAVIVKGGPSANVYNYDPEVSSDTNLSTPNNPNNGKPYGISHVTFVFNETDDETCYGEETAWAKGTRYVERGNWAMYVKYPGPGNEVDIIAGKSEVIGSVKFSDPDPLDGKVTLKINLTGGAIFYYDGLDPLGDDNLKIQDYAEKPPGKNPAPGKFKWKWQIASGETYAKVEVPLNNFYGIHLDVALPVPCADTSLSSSKKRR